MPVPISISRLTRVFGRGKSAVKAVDGVSLEIDAGELFFLLGPSGCGKTTLLRMIAGFETPTAGTIRFGNRDVTSVRANKRDTGMVFQSYALWPHMTVAANVAFGLGVRRIPARERKRLVAEALDAVQMTEYAKRKPNQLSGGQQQRVALARAMVIRPDVLLLDEPLSNLDAKLRIELRAEIRRICKDAGITTVYVTHDQKEALSMADRIGVLALGQVVQVGTPSDLYRHPRNRFVAGFLGEANFLPGQTMEREGEVIPVRTKVGVIRATPSMRVDESMLVTLAIRPESFRIIPEQDADSPNRLNATIVSYTLLGETAHLVVEHSSGENLLVSQLNPETTFEAGRQISLSVDPKHVIALAE
jgi:iron(III) transport system ATP-binding protein